MIKQKTAGLAAILCAAGVMALAGAAQANVITGVSSAYAESVAVTITPLIGVSGALESGPGPVAAGTAPVAYNEMHSALSLTIGNILNTGVLNAGAASNVDGSGGAKFASASASVDQLGLQLLNVLGIGATAIGSSAQISGDYGAFTTSGLTTLAGLSVGGIGILTVAPTVNDVLLDLAGLRIVLNEQIASGDGVSTAGLGVDAIHISLTDVPYLWGIVPSVLNGDIIIGHSEAFLTAAPSTGANPVPEPATLSLAGAALMGLFGLRRKRAVA